MPRGKKKADTPVDLKAAREKLEVQLSNLFQAQARYLGRLGRSFGGKRDLYEICGYIHDLNADDYLGRYERQDIARAVVNALPDATWRAQPEIIETDDRDIETEFEKAWDSLAQRLQIFHYLNRLDRISGIGRYGVLLLGLDGAEPLNKEAKEGGKRELLYVRCFDESMATIKEFETDPANKRYGYPLEYSLNLGEASGTTKNTVVHWSRVIHVAEDCLTDNVFGTPRLKAVWNRLQDLETVIAGSTEMFWRGGFPGIAFIKDPEVEITDDDKATMETEIENYIHSMQRYLRLSGVEPKAITQQIGDPKSVVDVLLTMVSAASRIPKRILTGAESGELASSMDEANWLARVSERRHNHAEAMIIWPLVERLQYFGILPKPKEAPHAIWPEQDSLSPQDRSEAIRQRAAAIAIYAKNGGQAVLPVQRFLVDVLGYPEAAAKKIALEAAKFVPPAPPATKNANGNGNGNENDRVGKTLSRLESILEKAEKGNGG